MSGRGLLRTAGVVGLLTLASRITGLLLQRTLTAHLGLGAISDAFQVAYRLPNLLRRFTAEGTLTSALVPALVDLEARRGRGEGRRFMGRLTGTLIWCLAGLTLLGLLAMTPVTGLMMLGKLAPAASPLLQLRTLASVLAGHGPLPADVALGVHLGRIMFPYLFLVSLAAALAGALNARHRFTLPASVNAFGNVAFLAFSWTALAWMGHPGGERAAVVLASAMLVHGSVQVALLVPAFLREGFRLGWMPHLGDPDVRRMLVRMAPGLLAAGIHPLNVLLGQVLASQLAPGAQTVMGHASVMGELVLGLFAISIATVSLPTLSRLAAEQDREGFRTHLSTALRGAALLGLPSAVGLAVLARPIVALVFQKGAYGPEAVAWTASTLPWLALGLPFIGALRISAQSLHAAGDFRGPAWAAILALLVNLVASLLLMGPMGTSGIALAGALSALAGLAALGWRLKRVLGPLPMAAIGEAWARMGLASLLMGLAAWAGAWGLALGHFHGTLAMALRLLPLIAACAVLYGLLLLALRVSEAQALLARLKRRP